MGLFSTEEEQAMHAKFHRENPTAPRSKCYQCQIEKQRETTHAIKTVRQIVREDATVTVKELAQASERRPSWVRRVLKENGLSAPEAVREPLLPRSKRPCTVCGHLRFAHCSGRSPRRHVQHAQQIITWPCPMTRHCKSAIEVSPGQFVNCTCSSFTLTVEKKPKIASVAAAAAIPRGLLQGGRTIL